MHHTKYSFLYCIEMFTISILFQTARVVWISPKWKRPTIHGMILPPKSSFNAIASTVRVRHLIQTPIPALTIRNWMEAVHRNAVNFSHEHLHRHRQHPNWVLLYRAYQWRLVNMLGRFTRAVMAAHNCCSERIMYLLMWWV